MDNRESELNSTEKKTAEEFVAPLTGYAPAKKPEEIRDPGVLGITNPEAFDQQEERAPRSRTEVMVRAVKEFLTGNFEKGKEHLLYISLQKELEKRGVIPEGYYPGSLAMLQSTERILYAYKEILSKFSAFVDPNNPSSLSGMTSIRKELTNRISDNNPISLDERRSLDQDSDDSATLNFMRGDFAAQEAKRQEAIMSDEKGFMSRMESNKERAEQAHRQKAQETEQLREQQAKEAEHYQDYLENDFPKQAKNIETWESLIDYYEGIQEAEETSFQQVQTIITKDQTGELDAADLDVLSTWLENHKEFGLEEMSDSEYFAYFQDGRVYAHSTSFFGDRDRSSNEVQPRFIEALKDSYLLSSIIGDARKDVTFHNMVHQTYVMFDGPDLMAREMYKPKLTQDRSGTDENLHFSYGVSGTEGPYQSPPVTLIAPARLLEKQSTDLSLEDQLNTQLGVTDKIKTRINPFDGYRFMDGVPFGSGNSDPNDPAHEINLEMFVAVVPDIEVGSEFIQGMINNLLEDERSSSEMKSELSNLESSYGQKETIKFKDFMVGFAEIMKKNGFAMPRLFFFNPVVPFSKQTELVEADWIMRNGVQSFLEQQQIKLNGNPPKKFLHESQSTETPEGPEESYLDFTPEQFKFPAVKIEAVANQVRTILKKHQNTQPEALPLAA
jgi:hypothetical protein